MNDLRNRFESNVDRSGDHHLWTAARDAVRGTGRLKVQGKVVTAHRVAWELANGPLPASARVLACADEPACVLADHLRIDGAGDPAPTASSKTRGRARKGAGSMQQVRPDVWKLCVTAPADEDGNVRRVYRTVTARSGREAAEDLAAFVAEVAESGPPSREVQSLQVDDAIERFLTEHLRDERGREEKTVNGYRALHRKWFSPEIGHSLVRDIDRATIDRIFGRMRRAGLSRSRMNQAKSLYKPFFQWAHERSLTRRNPMTAFQLPTSRYVSRERTPPEVEELSILLAEAVTIAPEIAPILALGAVTGMRRGELVGLRRSRIRWDAQRIVVDSAMDGKRVKATKTRKERSFFVDEATIEMLHRLCGQIDDRAELVGATLVPDPFVFTLSLDGSEPMPADYVTKRVGVLKEHLGIEEKKPDTIAREDEALRLFRQEAAPRQPGVTGPAPKGGMSHREIGAHFGRSERWSALAVASAERREAAGRRGLSLDFDGSILALRKFTSSELLDAGFNVSMVAQRQGHGPQVLAKHYAKSRRSADRKAADHLGRAVHQGRLSENDVGL